MVTHIKKLIANILHTIGVLLLLVGLPAGLAFLVGWPLPDQVPDPAVMWLAIQQENIPAEVVINTLAVMVWLLWTQLAWAILWDLAVNTRRVAKGLDIRSAPFVVAGIDSLATRLASGTMAVSVLVASPAVASALPLTVTSTTSQEYVEITPTGGLVTPNRTTAVSTDARRPVWKVAKGDSAWSIAEVVLGDGSRFGEIAALNVHIDTARDVIPGIRLILPAGSSVPEDRNTFPTVGSSDEGGHTELDEAKTAGTAFEQAEQSASPESVTVVKGDHLWGLARTHLKSSTDRTPTDPEVAAFVQRLIAMNPDVVENPDLIFPGEVFQLPATDAETENTESISPAVTSGGYLPSAKITVERFDHLWGLSESRLEEAHGQAPTNLEILNYVNTVIDLNTDTVEDPDLIFPGEVFEFPAIGTKPVEFIRPKPAEDPKPVAEQPVTPTVPSTVPAPVSVDDTTPPVAIDQDEGVSATPYLLGLVGAVVTATGLLAAYRALKKRRDVLGVDVEGSKLGAVERAMIMASDLPLLRWAGQELSILVEGLNHEDVTGAPVLVEVSETGLELLWDKPQAVAPHPWEATDGGSAWRLLFDENAPIPEDELPAGIPGLVTLGTRDDGGTVLVDLEALGSLSVTGDQVMVENTIRAITLEIGASEELANIGVSVVGIDVDGGEHLPRIYSRSEDDAHAHLKAVADSFQAMISKAGMQDSFGLRAKTGVGPDCSVVVVNAASCTNLAELVAIAEPRQGVAVVVAGDVPSTSARLIVEKDGSAVLEPLGLRLNVTAMSRETASEIAVLMDAVATTSDPDPLAVSDEEVQQFMFGERNLPTSPATVETLDTATPAEIGSERLDDEATTVVVAVEDGTDESSGGTRKSIEDGAHPEASGDSLLAGEEEGGQVDLNGSTGPDGSEEDLTSDEVPWHRPTSDLMVRVLGDPASPGFETLAPRQVGLLAMLASNGGSATRVQLLDRLYSEQVSARSKKTLWNLIGSTRRIVGSEILPPNERSEPVRTTATTDLQLFEALVARAEVVSRNQGIELLSEAMALVQGAPFDHTQFDWAHSMELYEPARKVIEKAALRLSKLALEVDNIGVAREAINRGLMALGVNELLYRERMRIDAQSGDKAQVQKTFAELSRKLGQLFDDATPSQPTIRLLKTLVAAVDPVPNN